MLWLPVILIFPYLLLLLCIYRGVLIIKPFGSSTDPVTFVSVIVACRNEEKNLPHLLKCISDQEYPKNILEVIIVDDNSTDSTFEIPSGFAESGNIFAIHNKGKGKKQAIRTGINASSGSLIITTDADCLMGSNWIRTIAAFYEEKGPDMIICPVKIESGGGFFGRFQELEFLSLQGVTAGSAHAGNPAICNGANLAFTREVYLANSDNLHDEIASGDDIFLLHSLKKNPGSVILWLESEDVMVITPASPNTKSFFKQRSRWISKASAYNDRFSIMLGIVTFITIMLQVAVLAAGFINLTFIAVFITIFLLKSIPDFLILLNTSGRYGKRELITWFLPAQIVYPFYVLSVVFYSLISLKKPEY
ncbi:MAG: glycosyltransferase [Bacteroidia bacterium]|nr:glycosyltransferase [Bacteroidia bacterium]